MGPVSPPGCRLTARQSRWPDAEGVLPSRCVLPRRGHGRQGANAVGRPIGARGRQRRTQVGARSHDVAIVRQAGGREQPAGCTPQRADPSPRAIRIAYSPLVRSCDPGLTSGWAFAVFALVATLIVTCLLYTSDAADE